MAIDKRVRLIIIALNSPSRLSSLPQSRMIFYRWGFHTSFSLSQILRMNILPFHLLLPLLSSYQLLSSKIVLLPHHQVISGDGIGWHFTKPLISSFSFSICVLSQLSSSLSLPKLAYKPIFEGSLEVKLPTIWTDEKQSRAEAERRGRLEERRSEEKE